MTITFMLNSLSYLFASNCKLLKQKKGLCIYPTPLLQSGSHTRLIFKQSKAGSFFNTGYLTKTKESTALLFTYN